MGVSLASAPAHAYTISTVLTQGCHESITYDAMRKVRGDMATIMARPTDAQEKALIDDLQFKLDSDLRDFDAASLVLGARDNDIKGQGSQDLSVLAEVHGNPENQREHCLRGPDQHEPDGTARALADCHAFILERIGQAIDGLAASGLPDPANTTSLPVHLSIRGKIDADLPTFWVRMGQAIHAVQDSFTHTFRTPDEMQVTVALDWLDVVNGSLNEAVDGPAHESELDRCDDPDPIRLRRHQLAIEASAAVMEAALAPGATKEAKLAQVSSLLDKYMGFSAGCTYDNHWCNAPEPSFQPSGCGCSLVGASGPGGSSSRWGMAGMSSALVVLLALRRRRATRRLVFGKGRASTRLVVSLLAAGATSAFALETRADTQTTESPASGASEPNPSPPETPEDAAKSAEKAATSPPPPAAPVPEPGPANPTKMAIGGFIGAAGAFDKPALAATGGLRLRLSQHWTLGLDGEWNPFVSLNGAAIRSGVVNVYGDVIFRVPMAYENFNLRVTASLGGSYLLTELYGAPNGSKGIYLGVAPLGIEWKASSLFYLILNPLSVSVPIPQMNNVPFLYPQYRISLGLEFYAG